MINKILANETYTKKIVPVTLFLVIELMFLLSFNLGDLGVTYRVIALVFALVLLPSFLKTLNDDFGNGFIILFLPLVIYLLSMAFSPVFTFAPENPSSNLATINRDPFTIIFTILGSIAFLLLGYYVSRTKLLSRLNFIFLIYGGLGLLLLISLGTTLVNYGFFHRIFYQGMVNYYDARAYQIANQANILQGFSIATIDYKVLITLGLLLITPIFALLFIKEVKEKLYLYLLIAFAVIGGLTLIFLTDYKSLIFLIPALLLAVMLKFKLFEKKWFKISLITALSVGGLLIVLGVLASFEVDFVVTLLKSNALTNRLYYNGYTLKYMAIIRESLDMNYLFGNPYIDALGANQIIFPSGNLLLDAIRETGIIGAFALVALIVFAVKIAINYIKLSNDTNVTKYLVLGFLITLMSRYMINYAFNQLAFTESYWSINYFPFVESKEFAISLFLIGYMYIAKNKPIAIKNESEAETHE